MSIRETLIRRKPTLKLGAVMAAGLVLASCGPSASKAEQATATGRAADNATSSTECLDVVWRAQTAPDKAFDRAHDLADGGSISCATGTSASQFAAELAAIRGAAARDDRIALAAEVELPLLYIDRAGNKRELDGNALAAQASEVFSPPMLALLKQAQLKDLAVVPQEGAFLSLGAVWLVAGRAGGRPRIVTIDLRALDEATAARRK